MLIKLTEEQLLWVLDGTGFGDKVNNMFRDHYVNSIGKTDASKRNGVSINFATKKWARFEVLINDKCKLHGLEISTILHAVEDKTAVYLFDISNVQKQKEK